MKPTSALVLALLLASSPLVSAHAAENAAVPPKETLEHREMREKVENKIVESSKGMSPMTPPEAVSAVKKISGEKVNSTLISMAPLKSDYMMGKEDAPVTIIEYASLSCPHCAHFHNSVLPTLKKEYIDTGKARYIWRPFAINEPALKGSMLVDCVGEQDKARFFTFIDVLFDAQKNWAFDANYMQSLKMFAKVGGVSDEMFAKCTSDTEREMKILTMKKEAAEELKIPHTPYFIINGERYESDVTVEHFSAFIDAKLREASK